MEYLSYMYLTLLELFNFYVLIFVIGTSGQAMDARIQTSTFIYGLGKQLEV